MTEKIGEITKLVAAVCVVIFIFSYIFYAFWNHLAEEIPAQMGDIFEAIHRSIGEQYSAMLFALFNAIGGFIFAFS